MRGTHGEPRRGRFHDSNGPSGALSGWAVKTPVWTAPGLPWLLQGAYCARVGTSRGKKCESEYTSRKKVRNIPSKYEQTGRAHDTFDKFSLQVLKKGGGRTIHSSFFVFKGGKKGRAHDTFDIFCLQGEKKGVGARYIRQIVPSGPSRGVPQWGGPHGEPRRGRVYLSNGPF